MHRSQGEVSSRSDGVLSLDVELDRDRRSFVLQQTPISCHDKQCNPGVVAPLELWELILILAIRVPFDQLLRVVERTGCADPVLANPKELLDLDLPLPA